MAYRKIDSANPQQFKEFGIVHYEQIRAYRRGVVVGLLAGFAVWLLFNL